MVHFTLAQKTAVFVPAAATAIGLDMLLHAPLPLAIVGIAGAIALARESPKMYAAIKQAQQQAAALPAPKKEPKAQAAKADGKWTMMDRLLDKHHQQRAAVPEAEDLTDEQGDILSYDAEPVFPAYPEDETVRLGYVLESGARFDPHIDAFFGKGCITSAVQGSGKSMLYGLLMEPMGKCGVPLIVFDHKGEYAHVPRLAPLSGLRAGAASLQGKVQGVPFFDLSIERADAFVEQVMGQRLVVHLPSYGDGWVKRAAIIASVGVALMRWSAREREREGVLLPCLIFLDEAQLYLPQNVNLLPPEAQSNREVLNSLANAYFALVSNGRSNGYTVCFATQSLTYIAKWAIKSCQIKVFLRHAEKNDLDMCEQIISPRVATREQIETFPPGVGVVFGLTTRPMVVQFDKKESRDESETPGIERLRGGRQMAETVPMVSASPTLAEMTLDELLTLIGRLPEMDPTDSRYGTGEQETAQEVQAREKQEQTHNVIPMPVLKEEGPRAEEIDLALAIDLWNKGYDSDRKLAKVFRITKYQGNRLAKMIEDQAKKAPSEHVTD